MCCSGTTQGYSISCANQLSDTFNAKYHWDTKSAQDLHQSLIGSSCVLGMTIGASSAGKIIAIGRRLTLFLCCAIGILGVGITLIPNFYMMILGRLVYGFACGI